MSKASAREYYYTLERLTDNTSTVEIPGRYRELLRMIHQWRLLKVLKRHGRGHDPRGYRATRSGECTLPCPACPIPGINLPEGWFKVPRIKRWIYRLFLAMDANFRLVHLKVSSEDADPGLVNGYQYFVPSKKFQQDLVQFGNYTSENSTQSCNNHKAIGNANMRREAGLDSTGVAATSCSRHGMKLPCSHVDLQVGERFFNMDYSFLSSLMFAAFILLLMGGDVLLSYDPEDRQNWLKAVERWEQDQTNPNPYQSTVHPPTLSSVRLRLAKEEEEALKANQAQEPERETSLYSIILEGLEMRELQLDSQQSS
ncbi:hypothetical protein K435DRAFT_849407 [Dendrothele bispora CBS 962.96]|uniref:CxC2-like cysteine cluster KDZ transposase-associated domain-containing protein n=1 Tax=Dendrothele bispora (strain CBS 962.96) TaxID=1314807 RepID=A0A4S8MSV2_DENBC|nr:hypothetical protein K435DRAFT_849407 [Dendrothele bispora CBS 962.96]